MKSFDIYIACLEIDVACYEYVKALNVLCDEMEATNICFHSFCEACRRIKKREG